jgi:hypothetical protein
MPMQRLRNASLSLQLPLAAAACALLVGVCVAWLATASGRYLQETREADHGSALARQIAEQLADPLQRGDLLYVRAYLQRFVDSAVARAVRVNDVMGLPIAEAGEVEALEAAAHSAPVTVGPDIAGEVLLALQRGNVDGERRRLLLSLLALVTALSMLVFVAARVFAQRLATGLRALESQLLLPDSERSGVDNEIAQLRAAVEGLPVDMLRGQAAAPPAASDFRDTTVLYVHLAGLARYVDTLSESNLHRYTRRLQQLVAAAAQCYRGDLRVVRQFGLLITFAPQNNAGSEALRAASCARLIARLATDLERRTNLSLDLAMALGNCELAPDAGDEMSPGLYLRGSVDELRDACVHSEDYPVILVSAEALADEQLHLAAALDGEEVTAGDSGEHAGAYRELLRLSEEQETLVEHQAAMIAERIKPRQNSGS